MEHTILSSPLRQPKGKMAQLGQGRKLGIVRRDVYYTLDLCAIVVKFAEEVKMDIHIASNL